MEPTVYIEGHGLYFKVRDLPDGRRLFAYPIMNGKARLGIGDPESSFMDDLW